MDSTLVYFILLFNLAVAIFYFINKKCEVPLFIALFNAMVYYRIITLELGYSTFVNFNYKIDFEFTMELAYKISDLVLLGSSVMLYTFIFIHKPVLKKMPDSNQYLKSFLVSKRTYIFIGLLVFTIFQLFLSGNISEGYGNLSKLANSSFVLLMFLLFYFTPNTSIQRKLIYLAVFLFIGYVSYSPALRFQFLGWMIPVAYFLTYNIKPLPKLAVMIVGLFGIMVIFSAAGVLRYNQIEAISNEELYEESVERMQVSDDVNFIDGFMMMYQVYPKYLDHTNGVEHLNILLRPIPRTIWPGKPLAGWFHNYQEKYGIEKVSVGFSPTLYGVFYAEFAEAGIVILSIVWAFFLSYMYRTLSRFNSDLFKILIGIFLTALIPIFRSGDLAGDFAIVLMSYWPIIVFVYHYKKYVRKRILLENA